MSVTLLSLKTEKSQGEGVVKAEFSDGSSLVFSIDYLPEGIFSEKDLDFSPGRELSLEEEGSFGFAAACYRAEKSALRLIARAEQHSIGLTAKLERRGYEAAVVRTVVSRFLDRNLLDDRRYSERWIQSRLKQRKLISPLGLLAGLRKRGIGKDSAGNALNEVVDPETEYTLLLKYLDKAPQGKNTLPLRVQLKREGFSSAVIDRYFDEI